jgi:hypothetical protein
MYYKLICQKAPRPVIPVTIKDGEQFCNWGAHDVFESFLMLADVFEAAVIHSSEPPPCLNEEDTKQPKIVGFLKPWKMPLCSLKPFI